MFTYGQDWSKHGVRSFLEDFPMKAVYNRKWTTSSLKLNRRLPAGNLDLVTHPFQCVGDLLTIIPLDFDDAILQGPAAAA